MGQLVLLKLKAKELELDAKELADLKATRKFMRLVRETHYYSHWN